MGQIGAALSGASTLIFDVACRVGNELYRAMRATSATSRPLWLLSTPYILLGWFQCDRYRSW